MASVWREENGAGTSSDAVGSLRFQTGEPGAELRSWDQVVENGTPSTSPPYWDSDDDDDSGPRPSDLYGKFTWKIENFSQISKRELRSNVFEVGGYKWYILVYPQGCDVCNHLSLFLCVSDYDKLLPVLWKTIDSLKASVETQARRLTTREMAKKQRLHMLIAKDTLRIQSYDISMDLSKPSNLVEPPTTHAPGNHVPNQRSNLRCNSTANKSNMQSSQSLVKSPTQRISTTESVHPLHSTSVPPQSKPSCSDENISSPSSRSLLQCSGSTSEVTDISRPSSAPLIPAGPKPAVPVASVQPVPSLARSVSAAGRLGVGESFASNSTSVSQSPAITPSYKMAAAGKIRGTSAGHVPHWVSSSSTQVSAGPFQGSSAPYPSGFVQNPSSSSAFSSCTAPTSPPSNHKGALSCGHPLSQSRGDASPSSSVAITSSMPMSQSSLPIGFEKEQNIGPTVEHERPMGFTFGTVTPEMLNRQRSHELIQNVDGSVLQLDEKSPRVDNNQQQQSLLERCLAHQPHELQNRKVYQAHCEQDKFDIRLQQASMDELGMKGPPMHVYPSATDLRQAGSVMSEEFPHLDIINDLLDEEHYRGKALSVMLQHPGGQHMNRRLPFPGLQRINSGQLHPEVNLLNGDRVEIPRLHDDGLFQLHCSSDPSSIGLRGNLQVVPPYAHTPYGQSYGQQCGLFEGISPHHWPISSADFSGCSISNNGYGGLNAPMGYTMHGNHIALGDCPSFTSGQNEYTVFSPMKEM